MASTVKKMTQGLIEVLQTHLTAFSRNRMQAAIRGQYLRSRKMECLLLGKLKENLPVRYG
jgi:hypothetical protein